MSLLNKWFSRLLTTGRSRTNSPVSPLERLEPRLALAGDVARPLLERASILYVDSRMVGPEPIVMTKSQIVGHDVKSFVISHVPTGSVVEKLDEESGTWVDVSTKPTSSNPRDLLRLLQQRLIQQGDKIRWTPKITTENVTHQAFRKIHWDDGSSPISQPQNPPAGIKNLTATPGTEVPGVVNIQWERATAEFPTSITIKITSEWDVGKGPVKAKPRYIKCNVTSTNLYLDDLEVGATHTIEVITETGKDSNASEKTKVDLPGVGTCLTPIHLDSNCLQGFGENQYWEKWSNGRNLPHSTLTHQIRGISFKKLETVIEKIAKNNGQSLYKFNPKTWEYERWKDKKTGVISLGVAHYQSQSITDLQDKIVKELGQYIEPKPGTNSKKQATQHFTLGEIAENKQYHDKEEVLKDFVKNNCLKWHPMQVTIAGKIPGTDHVQWWKSYDFYVK